MKFKKKNCSHSNHPFPDKTERNTTLQFYLHGQLCPPVLMQKGAFIVPSRSHRGRGGAVSQDTHISQYQEHLTEGMNDNTTSRETRVRHSTCLDVCLSVQERLVFKDNNFSASICSLVGSPFYSVGGFKPYFLATSVCAYAASHSE